MTSTAQTVQSTTAAEENKAPSVAENSFDQKIVSRLKGFSLPQDLNVFDVSFAEQMLMLCTEKTAERTGALFSFAGFRTVQSKNYDKDPLDPSHTCAYCIGKKKIKTEDGWRDCILVSVRSTTAGEWYSNFDFAPSGDMDTAFAENFLTAAQDAYDALSPILSDCDNPLILLTGHSRGAACANLLAWLLHQDESEKQVSAYTFASATTVRGDAVETDIAGVFNVINPCDIVTRLPLQEWGFVRFGSDIVLPADGILVAALDRMVAPLYTCCPTVDSYYHDRHSVSEAGLSEDGVTVFEAFKKLFDSILSMQSGQGDADGGQVDLSFLSLLNISQQSDLAVFSDVFASMTSNPAVQESAGSVGMAHAIDSYMELLKKAGKTSVEN